MFLHIAALTNAGSTLECPSCGKHVRKFVRFHGLNDQCPSCGGLMRHRVATLYLRDVAQLPERGGDILHVAPSQGLRRWLVSLEKVRYLAVDLDSPLADLHADLTALPLDDSTYDLVICAHVLEHVPDDRAAMSEIYRVLRPGGTALIQVPPSGLEETFEDFSVTSPAARERVFGQYDHVRICGSDYGRRLEEAGFQVTVEDYAERLDAATRRRYGVRTGEPFYVCVRPANES